MTDYRDKDFTGQTVRLDGNAFTGCTFRNCLMVYRGETATTLVANHWKENNRWAFEGPAGNTLKFLAGFRAAAGEGGRELIDYIVDQIQGRAPILSPEDIRAGKGLRVMIQCPATGKAIPTGVTVGNERDLKYNTFNRTTTCPECGQSHPWTNTDAWVEGGESSL